MIRPEEPAPRSLVDGGGRLRYGVWRAPLADVDLDRVRLRGAGIGLPLAVTRFRLKQWQHFCVVLPDLLLTFAVVDTRYLGLSWCHVAALDGGAAFEHRRMGPRLRTRVARALWRDRTTTDARGFRIEIDNLLDEGHHRARIDIAAAGDRPAVSADLRCLHDLAATEPLVVCLPLEGGRGMYSHKVPLPVEGTVRVGDRNYTAEPGEAFAILDVHKAHYPRHTWWNWATMAGRDVEGRAVGLNLTRNVCLDEDELNENAVWLDGRITRLAPARFAFQRGDPLEPWHLTTTDGRVDVEFQPLGMRSENVRLGLVRSVFKQPFGRFRGRIRLDGETVEVDGPLGVCEDHDALW